LSEVGSLSLKLTMAPATESNSSRLERLSSLSYVVETKVPKARTSNKPNNSGMTLKTVKTSTSRSYHEYLIESLQDTRSAAAYLESFLEDGTETEILLALNHIAEAQRLKLDASNAIPSTSDQQYNLNLIALTGTLDTLGLKLSIAPKDQAA
jgi:DNA-binding phage protein